MKNQDNFYYNYESDAFFDRWQNKNTKFKKLRPHTKKTVDFISHHIDCDSISILEIGCFIGDKLNYFKETFNCKVHGIEPSKKACSYAKKKYNLKLENCTFRKSKFNNFNNKGKKFDLIILEDVLNWIDRNYIIHCIALVDHLIKNDGFIFIREYSPSFSYSNFNHHHPTSYNIKSYKHRNGYSSLFTNFGMYKIYKSVVEADKKFNVKNSLKEDHDICEDTILKKSSNNLFPVIKI